MSKECISRLLLLATGAADSIDQEIFESFWGKPDHFGLPRQDVEAWLDNIKEGHQKAHSDENQSTLEDGHPIYDDEILNKATGTSQYGEPVNQNALKVSYSYRFEGHCTKILSGSREVRLPTE